MTTVEPVWTQPASLEDWPTRVISSQPLRYKLPVPLSYHALPVTASSAPTSADQFLGKQAGELLSIEFMPVADPNAPLRDWVDLIVGLNGFPAPSIQKRAGYVPNLLSWEYEGAPDLFKQRLAVDELHLYQGLAQFFQESASSLARFYILLARRQTSAWKVTFSFLSACLPGMPPEIINDNDHSRAAATFGYLQFL